MGHVRTLHVRLPPFGLCLAIGLVVIGFSIAGCTHPPPAPTTRHSTPTTRLLEPSPAQTVLPADENRIPFRLVRSELYADVRIGSTTAPFMIDTGADLVNISPWVASKEALLKFAPIRTPLHKQDATGAFGKEEVSLTHISSMSMGGIRFRNFDAAITDTRAFHMGGPENGGGVLGWPVFKGVLLTIDYPNGVLIIRSGELPPADGHRVLQILVDNDGMLSIPITIGGKEIRVYPDTGDAGPLCLNKQQADGLQWHFPRIPCPVHGSVRSTMGLLGKLNGDVLIGDCVLEDPLVVVDAASQFGTIGYGILYPFAVTFDFKNMRMQLDPNPPPQLAIFSGLTFHCDHRKVVAVETGGVADKAGVRVGDEVVAVNGQPIDPSWSENVPPTTMSITGPVTISGPALVNGTQIPQGGWSPVRPNTKATVAYLAVEKTGPAIVDAELKLAPDMAIISNWGAGQSGPLIFELRRQGRTIWISLPIKPEYASTQPVSGLGDRR
jgi:predicted aspartyl protease